MANTKTIVENTATCGIEFELEDLSSNELGTNFSNWRRTHDASIETDKYTISNGRFLINSPINIIPYQRTVVGTELVSNVLHIQNNVYDELKGLTDLLTSLGESELGKRSGIHFHISFSNPTLGMLKSLLRVGRYLESVFFSIGGMGNKFRGTENDSIFCRPITQYGPVCVRTINGYGQIFSLNDLLKTKTQEEFWTLYGDSRNFTGRYVPVRYHWLNLYPLCPSGEYRGTVEFRIFNKSLNPDFIYSALLLCQKVTEYSLVSPFKILKEDNIIHENSCFDTGIDTSMAALKYFADVTNFDREIVNTLLTIMKRSGQPNIPSQYVYTHLRRLEHIFWMRNMYDYSPDSINKSSIKTPQFVDIHVLRGER